MKLFQASRRQSIFLTLIVSGFFSVHAEENRSLSRSTAENSISVSGGWVRLTPPVAKNSAAYFIIHNSGDKDVTIIDVSTPAAEVAAMHNTLIKQSMVRMVHLQKLLIPAASQVEFAPGGMHLMLINLTEKLTAEKAIAVTFKLDNGNVVTAKLVVESAGGRQTTEEHKGHEHQH